MSDFRGVQPLRPSPWSCAPKRDRSPSRFEFNNNTSREALVGGSARLTNYRNVVLAILSRRAEQELRGQVAVDARNVRRRGPGAVLVRRGVLPFAGRRAVEVRHRLLRLLSSRAFPALLASLAGLGLAVVAGPGARLALLLRLLRLAGRGGPLGPCGRLRGVRRVGRPVANGVRRPLGGAGRAPAEHRRHPDPLLPVVEGGYLGGPEAVQASELGLVHVKLAGLNVVVIPDVARPL